MTDMIQVCSNFHWARVFIMNARPDEIEGMRILEEVVLRIGRSRLGFKAWTFKIMQKGSINEYLAKSFFVAGKRLSGISQQ